VTLLDVGVATDAVVAAVPEEVDVDAAVPDAVDAVVAVLRLLASAGSCPVTRVIVISSHVATNRATAPDTTRRRII
jgi:hypothetical protein